jgi:hypothetical protein
MNNSKMNFEIEAITRPFSLSLANYETEIIKIQKWFRGLEQFLENLMKPYEIIYNFIRF